MLFSHSCGITQVTGKKFNLFDFSEFVNKSDVIENEEVEFFSFNYFWTKFQEVWYNWKVGLENTLMFLNSIRNYENYQKSLVQQVQSFLQDNFQRKCIV